MKQALSSLLLCAVSFSLVGCVDLEPGQGVGYGGPPRPVYGPGYESSPSTYYTGGGYDRRPDYERRPEYVRPAPTQSRNDNYYGGPSAWYQAGIGLGRRDRKQHVSPNYRRHGSQYDGKTEREFARGYNDGYNGR